MLGLEGLHAGYGNVRVLRDVTFAVDSGEIVALLGANGAGKTTALRAISGLVTPSDGRVLLDGEDVTGSPPERIARAGVAHVPQGGGVFGGLTVWQNLKMGGYADRLPPAELDGRIDEVLASFSALRARLAQTAGTLSGGERQMLAIARALIARPRVLLLDEPSDGLGPLVVDELYGLLGSLRGGGIAVLLVEQYAAIALPLADRAVVLERGRVIADAPAHVLSDDLDALAGAYLGR